MAITKTTTNVPSLKINYLTQEMYEDALANDELNENELYMTPGNEGSSVDSTDIPTAGKVAEFDSTAHMNSTDMTTGSGGEVETFVNSLNISSINAVDYIVEEGIDGDWTYLKRNSGKFEAWATSSYTGTITTGSGSLYYLNASRSLPSIGITSVKYASAEYTGGELTWCKLGTVSTTAIGFTFCSSLSRSTSTTRTVMFHVIGTWE